jgi:hypothetical protein
MFLDDDRCECSIHTNTLTHSLTHSKTHCTTLHYPHTQQFAACRFVPLSSLGVSLGSDSLPPSFLRMVLERKQCRQIRVRLSRSHSASPQPCRRRPRALSSSPSFSSQSLPSAHSTAHSSSSAPHSHGIMPGSTASHNYLSIPGAHPKLVSTQNSTRVFVVAAPLIDSSQRVRTRWPVVCLLLGVFCVWFLSLSISLSLSPIFSFPFSLQY